MPIYEYHCLACGEQFEKLVYGRAMAACPRCASDDVSRLLSKFGRGNRQSGGTFAGSMGGGCGCASGGGCGCR